MNPFEIVLPIDTVSESNTFQHWSKKYKRHQLQKLQIKAAFKNYSLAFSVPCVIKLTRLSPRELDYDNLVSSFKWIRDGVSEQITGLPGAGRSDNHPGLRFEYGQEKSREKGVKIKFYADSEHTRNYNRILAYTMFRNDIKDDDIKEIMSMFSYDELREFIDDSRRLGELELHQIDLMTPSQRDVILSEAATLIAAFGSKHKKKLTKAAKHITPDYGFPMYKRFNTGKICC